MRDQVWTYLISGTTAAYGGYGVLSPEETVNIVKSYIEIAALLVGIVGTFISIRISLKKLAKPKKRSRRGKLKSK